MYIYKFIVKHVHDSTIHYAYQPLNLKTSFFKMFLKKKKNN